MTPERRAQPRTPVDVEVRVMTSFGLTITGRVVDISPSGLRIRFHRAIREGTRLSLILGQERFFGVVRHCEAVETKFDVGVRIHYAIRPGRMSA